MATFGGKKGEQEVDDEPQIESENMEERIAARRLRIQRRQDAVRRAAMGTTDEESKSGEVELSKSRKQMEQSRLRLQKLREDGDELVTNIRVAIDCREQIRRREEEEARQQRKDNQERDAKAGQEKFEEITRKWESAMQKEIPQDLYEMLQQQKNACNAMIEDKDKVIRDLDNELKMRSDEYVRDLKKEADDVELLAERMEDQIRTMTRAYRDELLRIEQAFLEQRKAVLAEHKEEWSAKMVGRSARENEFVEERQMKIAEYETELHQLQTKDAEEFNAVKRKLENDVMVLEQQYQQMKATYQLNQEKLEYNFQVLKKRDEENTHAIGEQKRKITKQQDNLNNVRIKFRKQEHAFASENVQLTNEYKKVVDQLRHLQKKSKNLLLSDHEKFRQVWLMNEEEARKLALRILQLDRLIFEHQLGMEYAQSNQSLEFLDNRGPINDSDDSSAMAVASKIFSSSAESDKVAKAQDEAISPEIIRGVLELLSDETGFLVEEKLQSLLSPLEQDEKNLMKLDAIFAALNIRTEQDVRLLTKYFVNFAQTRGGSTVTRLGDRESTVERSGLETSVSGVEGVKQQTEGTSAGVAGPTGYSDGTQGQSGTQLDPSDSTMSSEKSIHFNAQLIDANSVYAALRQFVQDHSTRSPKNVELDFANFKVAELKSRDSSDDAEYWKKYGTVVAPEREKLWDAIVYGLERYHQVLQTRANLLTENERIGAQNAELRLLLQQYITSNINAELEVPPTKYMQVE